MVSMPILLVVDLFSRVVC